MGGKKKSTRKAPKKVIKRLPKAFKCPYCDHEGTVEVKMYDVVALLLKPRVLLLMHSSSTVGINNARLPLWRVVCVLWTIPHRFIVCHSSCVLLVF
jgi:hypothetical protein